MKKKLMTILVAVAISLPALNPAQVFAMKIKKYEKGNASSWKKVFFGGAWDILEKIVSSVVLDFSPFIYFTFFSKKNENNRPQTKKDNIKPTLINNDNNIEDESDDDMDDELDLYYTSLVNDKNKDNHNYKDDIDDEFDHEDECENQKLKKV